MAGRSVVGGHARVREQARRLGVRRVAEAQQGEVGRPGGQQLVLPDEQRRGADPAADEQRPLAGRVEAVAQGAGEQDVVPCRQPGEQVRAGPDVLQEELQAPLVQARDREGARQERALVGPAAPARRREHEELPRGGRGPGRVVDLQQDVGADVLARRDQCAAAPERRRAHARAASWARWISCSDSTPASPVRALAIARAAARPPASVVRHGMPAEMAARRISHPSVRAPDPVGVLTTMSTRRSSIQSTTWGEPSPILLIASTGIPMRRIASAVPRVATIENPRSCNATAIAEAPDLSLSVTVMKTVPRWGSAAPAAACALAKAVGKSRAMPITSPVERISGVRTASEPSKRSNGRTASLTLTWSQAIGSAGRSRSAMRSPSITRQAILASGIPTALDTNGTVREARGLASMT